MRCTQNSTDHAAATNAACSIALRLAWLFSVVEGAGVGVGEAWENQQMMRTRQRGGEGWVRRGGEAATAGRPLGFSGARARQQQTQRTAGSSGPPRARIQTRSNYLPLYACAGAAAPGGSCTGNSTQVHITTCGLPGGG